MCDKEIPLTGGMGGAVRAGATVRKTRHSERISLLLGRLRAAGFSRAPRFHGVDERGRDVLEYLPGTVGNYPLPRQVRTHTALVSAALLTVGTGGVLFLLTQYFQFVRGFSAFSAGLAVVPLAVGTVFGSAAGARAPARIGARWCIAAGFAVIAAGFLLLATLTPDSPILVAVLGLLLAGTGSGFAGPSTNSTVLGAVSGERAGMGAALNDTHQQLGIALSVAGLGSLFAAGYRARLPEPFPGRLGDSVAASFGYTVHRPEFAAAVRLAFTGAQGVALGVAAGAAALGALVAVLALRGHQGA